MDQHKAIRLAEEVVKWCEQIDSRGTPGMFRVILDIARHPGSRQSKIQERTGVSQTTSSRTIVTHTGYGKRAKYLYPKQIIEQEFDPEDRRQRVLDMTPAGKALIHELMDRLEPLLDAKE